MDSNNEFSRNLFRDSTIHQVFTGAVEMLCPKHEEDCDAAIAEVEEELAVRRDMIKRARFWDAAQPAATCLLTLFTWSVMAKMNVQFNNDAERLVYLTMYLVLPVAFWMAMPPVLRNQYSKARHIIKLSGKQLVELEGRLEYLRTLRALRALRAQRGIRG